MSYLKFTPLTPELYEYTLDILQEESQILQQIQLQNQIHPQIQMQISSDQAQFLQFLIRSKGIKTILEIGTFLGYSTAAMAEALPKNGKIITCDIDIKTSTQAKSQWQLANIDHKIEFRLGNALDTMHDLIVHHQQFDLIFIDADKRNSIAYYECAKKLLASNGVIAVDNIFFHGAVCQAEKSKPAMAMHEFNLYVKHDKDVHFTILPIADGLMLIQKK